MLRVEIPPTILVSEEVIAEAEKMKKAAAEVKAAAEKVRGGDFDGAIAALKPILEKNPKDSNALYILGMAHQKKAQWAEAEAAFLQVRELTPGFPAVHYQLGVLSAGRRGRSPGLLRQGHGLDPSNPDSAYNSGLILFSKSQAAEAPVLFESAELKPDDRPSLAGPYQPRRGPQPGRGSRSTKPLSKALMYLERPRPDTPPIPTRPSSSTTSSAWSNRSRIAPGGRQDRPKDINYRQHEGGRPVAFVAPNQPDPT
jgi:tetratricopeptide (TPR) repeat protein